MRHPQKKCRFCHRWFKPHPRSYRQGRSRQGVCGLPACQTERRRRNWTWWRQKNPEYGDSCRPKQKTWAQSHPGYWKKWRTNHPGYVSRNRKTQRRRDALRKSNLAKPIAFTQGLIFPIDGICDYLGPAEKRVKFLTST